MQDPQNLPPRPDPPPLVILEPLLLIKGMVLLPVPAGLPHASPLLPNLITANPSEKLRVLKGHLSQDEVFGPKALEPKD